MQTVIKKFKDEYFYECQWTGQKSRVRYGIPKEELGKERRGTFLDPACAAAYVVELEHKGKLDRKKAEKLLSVICKDLGLDLSGQDLKLAPEVDAAIQTISLDYQKKFPYMLAPKSGYVSIHNELDAYLSKREKSEEKGASKSSKKTKKQFMYTVLPAAGSEGGSYTSYCCPCEFKNPLVLEEPILVKSIVFTSYKSKDCTLLCSDNSPVLNNQIASMFSQEPPLELRGDVHILMRKPLHEGGAEEEGPSVVSIEKKESPASKKRKHSVSKESRELKINSQVQSVLYKL